MHKGRFAKKNLIKLAKKAAEGEPEAFMALLDEIWAEALWTKLEIKPYEGASLLWILSKIDNPRDPKTLLAFEAVLDKHTNDIPAKALLTTPYGQYQGLTILQNSAKVAGLGYTRPLEYLIDLVPRENFWTTIESGPFVGKSVLWILIESYDTPAQFLIDLLNKIGVANIPPSDLSKIPPNGENKSFLYFLFLKAVNDVRYRTLIKEMLRYLPDIYNQQDLNTTPKKFTGVTLTEYFQSIYSKKAMNPVMQTIERRNSFFSALVEFKNNNLSMDNLNQHAKLAFDAGYDHAYYELAMLYESIELKEEARQAYLLIPITSPIYPDIMKKLEVEDARSEQLADSLLKTCSALVDEHKETEVINAVNILMFSQMTVGSEDKRLKKLPNNLELNNSLNIKQKITNT